MSNCYNGYMVNNNTIIDLVGRAHFNCWEYTFLFNYHDQQINVLFVCTKGLDNQIQEDELLNLDWELCIWKK